MNRDSFGPTIRRLRIEQGLTQQKLAEMAGVSETTVVLIETGKHGATIDTASLLLEALGCELVVKKKAKL